MYIYTNLYTINTRTLITILALANVVKAYHVCNS